MSYEVCETFKEKHYLYLWMERWIVVQTFIMAVVLYFVVTMLIPMIRQHRNYDPAKYQ